MMSVLVETEDLVSMAHAIQSRVADPVFGAYSGVWNVIEECAPMAGSDPGGLDWAQSYQHAANAAFRSSIDLLNACARLAAMCEQTARNYAHADTASTADRARLTDVVDAAVHIDFYSQGWPLPPAAGGSGTAPHGWGLVAHLISYIWPNGHPDRLRRAGAAWRSASGAFTDAAGSLMAALVDPSIYRMPEFDDMYTVFCATEHRLLRLGHTYRDLGAACDALADHIEDVHSAIEDELVDLLEWTAGIEVAGGLLSFLSFGASEGAAQVAEGSRIVKTAATITSLIERFIALARTLAESVSALAERASAISTELRDLLSARVTAASATLVGKLPPRLRAINDRLVTAAESLADTVTARKLAMAATDDVAISATRMAEIAADDRLTAEAAASYRPTFAIRGDFEPPKTYFDRHGRLTNGTYTVNTKMLRHTTGSLASGKSQFFMAVDAGKAVLDAAAYADEHGLWVAGHRGLHAKVYIVNGPVGVCADTGLPTRWLNVYVTRTRFVHGSPGNPP